MIYNNFKSLATNHPTAAIKSFVPTKATFLEGLSIKHMPKVYGNNLICPLKDGGVAYLDIQTNNTKNVVNLNKEYNLTRVNAFHLYYIQS